MVKGLRPPGQRLPPRCKAPAPDVHCSAELFNKIPVCRSQRSNPRLAEQRNHTFPPACWGYEVEWGLLWVPAPGKQPTVV